TWIETRECPPFDRNHAIRPSTAGMAHRMRCDPTICQAFRLDLLIPLCIFWFGHLARRTGFRVLSRLVPPPAREQWRELRLEARGQRRKVLETYLRWPHAHGSQDVVGQPAGVPE